MAGFSLICSNIAGSRPFQTLTLQPLEATPARGLHCRTAAKALFRRDAANNTRSALGSSLFLRPLLPVVSDTVVRQQTAQGEVHPCFTHPLQVVEKVVQRSSEFVLRPPRLMLNILAMLGKNFTQRTNL